MAERQYWVISRPKRKLILVPDLLKIFSAAALGQTWTGNRALQKRFERNLTNAHWKAQNLSDDGSGGRTYAALLYLLGLWYEDDNNEVRITLAGQEILDGDPPIPIITKQLLDFQYPSPYSIKPSVNVSRSFRVRPFRFILKLFLERNVERLTQDEIAFCLVPYAINDSCQDICLAKIHDFRTNRSDLIKQAVVDSGTTEDNLRNIGNTAVNNFEYSGYFIEQEDIKSLEIKPSKIQEANDFLSSLRKSMIQNPEDAQTFQKHYGTGLKKSKDYSDSIRQPLPINPNERKILEQFYIIASNEPIFSMDSDLVDRVSTSTGATKNMVKNTLERLPLETQANQFYQSYLQLSVGGNSTAEDFERKTCALYNEGFKINAWWVGRKPRHPDIILFFDVVGSRLGIIDTKAYSEYHLPLDHKNKMAYTYIPKFRTYDYNGKTYRLSFFGYVAGGFTNTISSSFNELIGMTAVSGHLISAQNLLTLLEIYRQRHLNFDKLIEIFTINKEIIPYEII